MDKRPLLMFLIGLCATMSGPAKGGSPAPWTLSGHDPANSRSQPAESPVGPANAHLLTVKWAFTTTEITGSTVLFGDAV